MQPEPPMGAVAHCVDKGSGKEKLGVVNEAAELKYIEAGVAEIGPI